MNIDSSESTTLIKCHIVGNHMSRLIYRWSTLAMAKVSSEKLLHITSGSDFEYLASDRKRIIADGCIKYVYHSSMELNEII